MREIGSRKPGWPLRAPTVQAVIVTKAAPKARALGIDLVFSGVDIVLFVRVLVVKD